MSAPTTAPPPGLPRAQEVLDFWFGPDPLSPAHFAARLHLWFGGDDPPELIAERDAQITARFRPWMDEAAAGALDHWAGSPHRLLALVLMLDQFPRHVYRGRARAYAQDSRALAFTLHALTTGADATLSLAERLFLYLPLQHAESAAMQEESIAAYRRLLADAPRSEQEAVRVGAGVRPAAPGRGGALRPLSPSQRGAVAALHARGTGVPRHAGKAGVKKSAAGHEALRR